MSAVGPAAETRGRLRRRLRAAALVAGVALAGAAVAGRAQACACCAEPGDRIEQTLPLDPWARDVLDTLAPAAAATLHMGPCGEACVLGLRWPQRDWTARLAREGSLWRLELEGDEGVRGALTFALPETYTLFAVDPAPRPDAGPPLLYKEWRMEVALRGEGLFRAFQVLTEA